jgi:hypothetical protein
MNGDPLKKPGRAGACANEDDPGAVCGVIERCIGAAVEGAVVVEGGAV